MHSCNHLIVCMVLCCRLRVNSDICCCLSELKPNQELWILLEGCLGQSLMPKPSRTLKYSEQACANFVFLQVPSECRRVLIHSCQIELSEPSVATAPATIKQCTFIQPILYRVC